MEQQRRTCDSAGKICCFCGGPRAKVGMVIANDPTLNTSVVRGGQIIDHYSCEKCAKMLREANMGKRGVKKPEVKCSF